MNVGAKLQSALEAILPAGVAVCVLPIETVAEPLFAQEEAAMQKAVAKRRQEFALGRMAARRALRQLGIVAGALPVRADRQASWPAGVTGSISHNDQWCVAVVAKQPNIVSIGVDIEVATPLDAGLEHLVCLASEQAKTAQDRESGLTAKRIFSAKEAAFKCQYPLTQRMFGFERFEVKFPNETSFVAEFQTETPPFKQGDLLRGHSLRMGGQFLSLVILGENSGY